MPLRLFDPIFELPFRHDQTVAFTDLPRPNYASSLLNLMVSLIWRGGRTPTALAVSPLRSATRAKSWCCCWMALGPTTASLYPCRQRSALSGPPMAKITTICPATTPPQSPRWLLALTNGTRHSGWHLHLPDLGMVGTICRLSPGWIPLLPRGVQHADHLPSSRCHHPGRRVLISQGYIPTSRTAGPALVDRTPLLQHPHRLHPEAARFACSRGPWPMPIGRTTTLSATNMVPWANCRPNTSELMSFLAACKGTRGTLVAGHRRPRPHADHHAYQSGATRPL